MPKNERTLGNPCTRKIFGSAFPKSSHSICFAALYFWKALA
jgi:hypothetical protein